MELLIEKLIEEDRIALAVQLMEGLCREKAFPEEEANWRLKLSNVLTEFSTNYVQSRDHVLRARFLLERRTDVVDLRCKIVEQLGYCHFLIGDFKSQLESYREGLRICETNKDGRMNEEEIEEWTCCFELNIYVVQVALLKEDLAGLPLRPLRSPKHKIIRAIVVATTALLTGRISEGKEFLAVLRLELEGVKDREGDIWKTGSALSLLLEGLLALQAQSSDLFGDKEQQSPLSKIQSVNDLLCSVESDPFGLMPIEFIRLTATSVASALCLQSGLTHLASELAGQVEESVGISGRCSGEFHRHLTRLRAFAIEIKIRTLLLTCRLVEAQDLILQLVSLVDSEHLDGLNKLAIAHFERSAVDDFAAPFGGIAVAELRGDSSKGVAKATEWIKRGKESSPCAETSSLCFASGMIEYKRGDYLVARSLMASIESRPGLPADIRSSVFAVAGGLNWLEGRMSLSIEMIKKAYESSVDCGDKLMAAASAKAMLSIKQVPGNSTEGELNATGMEREVSDAIKRALARVNEHRRILKWNLT